VLGLAIIAAGAPLAQAVGATLAGPWCAAPQPGGISRLDITAQASSANGEPPCSEREAHMA
jgi:hypothetical protein